MSEIVALAMNSTLMEKVTKIGDGIETIGSQRNAKVSVRDGTKGQLELAVDDTNKSTSDVEKDGKFVRAGIGDTIFGCRDWEC